MIQHNGYSDDALVWIESELRTYLKNNLTGPEIRDLAAKDIDARTIKWGQRTVNDMGPLLERVNPK